MLFVLPSHPPNQEKDIADEFPLTEIENTTVV